MPQPRAAAPDLSTAPPPLPPDDPRRSLAAVDPDGAALRHVAVAGGVYTILLSGAETAGRFALIEMRVPPDGGPPPHRHDFEEMFEVLEGEVEFTFRGESSTVRVGTGVSIPANAPHSFRNRSASEARLLCLVAPAGEEDFFLAVGDPVASRTSPPPALTAAERAERQARAKALGPYYKNEIL